MNTTPTARDLAITDAETAAADASEAAARTDDPRASAHAEKAAKAAQQAASATTARAARAAATRAETEAALAWEIADAAAPGVDGHEEAVEALAQAAPAPHPTATQSADTDRAGAKARTAQAKANGHKATSGKATKADKPKAQPVKVTTETVKTKAERPACLCGCGDTTSGGSYRPGHDARHAGQVGRAIAAGGDADTLVKALPTDALRAKAVAFAARQAAQPEGKAERAALASERATADRVAREAIRATHSTDDWGHAQTIAASLTPSQRVALLAALALGA